MKSVRALGAVALMIALLAAGGSACPCAERPSDRGHGCCAQGAAIGAAGSDCCARVDAALGAASSVEGSLALFVNGLVVPLPAPAPSPQDALRRGASAVPVSPPTVLRI